ncbi:MAG: pyridoxal-phosphate dependent enzyme [Alphaproteobacteria bacterium]|nr:pyridoxal-phosphate dependent enzyme [Alphaproteobacteria bacterium]MCB9797790.1 pyridoxal-phosphate dependent enzyme [Alphaproteobacteria bacterium]
MTEGEQSDAEPGARPLLQAAEMALGELDLSEAEARCADPSVALEDRLDAYEDVFESQVGDSLFTRARNLERLFGLRQIWIKFEGDNPSGTQKDRIAFAQCADALSRGFDVVTVATCGNYGVAMALATRVAGLRCVTFIPEPYHTKRVEEARRLGAEIRRAGQTYEDAVARSRAMAESEGWYDANPGGDNERVQLRAYAEIAFEIYDELRDAPTVLAAPMSNGTTLAGVHRGFRSLYRRGKTSRRPRMVGGSAWRKNPIVAGFEAGLDRCPELDPASIRESVINEPLINWQSIDGDAALSAIRGSGGFAAGATDQELKQMARLLRDHQALSVLPASTAGLCALLQLHKQSPLPPDRYVILLTGRSS